MRRDTEQQRRDASAGTDALGYPCRPPARAWTRTRSKRRLAVSVKAERAPSTFMLLSLKPRLEPRTPMSAAQPRPEDRHNCWHERHAGADHEVWGNLFGNPLIRLGRGLRLVPGAQTIPMSNDKNSVAPSMIMIVSSCVFVMTLGFSANETFSTCCEP